MKGRVAPLFMRMIGMIFFYLLLVHMVFSIGLHTSGFDFGSHRFASHAITSALFTLSCMIFFQSKRLLVFLALYCFHFLLPIFAPIFTGTILTTVFFTNKSKLLGDLHEVEKDIDERMGVEQHLSYTEFVHENMKVEPLVEIIRSHASPDIKRGAIETLTNICNPDSILLLKESLSDQNVEVRFYASSALTKIEERLNSNILEYKKKRDAGDLSLHNTFELGKAYFEFVYLRIQDESSLVYYMNQSIQCFEEVVRKSDSTKDHIRFLQKAYTRAGRHDEARDLKMTQDRQQDKSADNLMYLAETYFKEGEFAKCKKVIESEAFNELKWDAVMDVKDLWLRELELKS